MRKDDSSVCLISVFDFGISPEPRFFPGFFHNPVPGEKTHSDGGKIFCFSFSQLDKPWIQKHLSVTWLCTTLKEQFTVCLVFMFTFELLFGIQHFISVVRWFSQPLTVCRNVESSGSNISGILSALWLLFVKAFFYKNLDETSQSIF